LFEVLSLLKGAVAQYPSYSIAHSNLKSVTGNSCALADYVLVEDDTNASTLQLVTPPEDLAGAGAFESPVTDFRLEWAIEYDGYCATAPLSSESTSKSTTAAAASVSGAGDQRRIRARRPPLPAA
ncbi:arabinosyltransferase C-terminal domain-containing protein, partial [Prescottella defluvii]|uniref:arabinosyltransferase C-terminal domain-containing protein n=1 Tax=Prescottella defluvii TaxID=1323361 RepID=UPI00055FB57D